MVRCFLILAVMPFFLFSQEDEEVRIDKGLLRATATISPSVSLSNAFNSIYLNGELEYYFEPTVSLRGDFFYLAGTLEEKQFLSHHHHLFVGPQWHYSKAIIDLFCGFGMGLNFTELNANYLIAYPNRFSISPNFTINSGVNFYIFKYAHFFFNVRYMHASYRGYYQSEKKMNELIFSGGLGFQIQTRKN